MGISNVYHRIRKNRRKIQKSWFSTEPQIIMKFIDIKPNLDESIFAPVEAIAVENNLNKTDASVPHIQFTFPNQTHRNSKRINGFE